MTSANVKAAAKRYLAGQYYQAVMLPAKPDAKPEPKQPRRLPKQPNDPKVVPGAEKP